MDTRVHNHTSTYFKYRRGLKNPSDDLPHDVSIAIQSNSFPSVSQLVTSSILFCFISHEIASKPSLLLRNFLAISLCLWTKV
ncbi:uncharacterized protein VTP21DRAFT_9354 [Calcarisporiella thermophila]|uniref:uncharacterized protein n=1 Tax=Calcarisporiella thermophila TaxID=911321 RepID=UPI0037433642